MSSDLEMMRRLWPWVRGDRAWIIGVLLLTPLGVGLGLLQPLVLQTAIDGHIAVGQMNGVAALAAAYVALVTFGFGARALSMYGLQRVGLRGLTRLRRGLFTHVTQQGQRFFDRQTTGGLMTRTTNDVDAVYESLSMGAVSLLTDALTIVGTLVAMLLLDWRLTLVCAATAPIIIVVVEVFRRRLRAWSLVIRAALSRLNGFFAERVHGMSVVQLYGAEEASRREFAELGWAYADAYRRSNWWDAGLYAIMDGMSAFAVGLVLWYGAGRVFEPQSGVTLGLLVAFIDYLNKVFVPIREFSGNLATLQRSTAALERVFQLLDTQESIRPGTHPVASVQGHVRFDHVTFRYGPDRPEVLQDVTLEVRAGEVLALVGATGSGKSTIGKLLTRSYDGYTGSITLDGQELHTLAVQDLRTQVTVVHQDGFLFDGTLAENVTLGDPNISAERLAQACAQSRLSEVIAELPDGLEHRVTERGSNLSVGQKQLVAIARALVRDAPLVILDEATASVDSLTERRIDDAIAELFARKTVIVIAHRLSTITRADRIVVLHRGQVAEQGTHDALLAAGGRYKLLVESGFSV
ncbi:MAG: ABC transporter ATP-binding protein [Bradymonadia bacterium]|jgi:ATP-binding cassette subfamily B protein